MSRTKRYLIQTLLFVSVFVILLLIATFFDLSISNILVHNSIPIGKFYSSDVFGRFIEYVGSSPIYLFGAFACLIFMHKIYEYKDYRKYLAIIFIMILVILYKECVGDIVKYYCRNNEIEHIYENNVTSLILYSIGVVLAGVSVFFYRKVSKEKNDNLVRFAFVILCTALCYLLIELIKTPVGRMRYRAMHLINDFSFFTPWYEISNARELLSGNELLPSDSFKSFPSGHTFSGGVIYVLICMPYLYSKFDTKRWKIVWYLIPICYTATVGIFRIVVGAHYMSDVLFGGTIAYVAAELFKYLLIVRNKEKENVVYEK